MSSSQSIRSLTATIARLSRAAHKKTASSQHRSDAVGLLESAEGALRRLCHNPDPDVAREARAACAEAGVLVTDPKSADGKRLAAMRPAKPSAGPVRRGNTVSFPVADRRGQD